MWCTPTSVTPSKTVVPLVTTHCVRIVWGSFSSTVNQSYLPLRTQVNEYHCHSASLVPYPLCYCYCVVVEGRGWCGRLVARGISFKQFCTEVHDTCN